MGYIEAGKRDGATRADGRRRAGSDGGYYVNPTILVDVNPQMSVVREEIFGPVVVAQRFEDLDEVAKEANDTPYGLAAGVWTKDVAPRCTGSPADQGGHGVGQLPRDDRSRAAVRRLQGNPASAASRAGRASRPTRDQVGDDQAVSAAMLSPYVRNAWYVAAWSHEIEAGKPFRRLDPRRTDRHLPSESGRLVALEDRCVHRLAPLSLGRCEGERLRCMYHGLLYDPDGAVAEIPGQDLIPKNARVKAYPVRRPARLGLGVDGRSGAGRRGADPAGRGAEPIPTTSSATAISTMRPKRG